MDDKMTFKRSYCPITNSLDILGDKWTLLVIRDLVLGKRRYQEFMSSPENIASNILADRLKQLETSGLVTRRAPDGGESHFRVAVVSGKFAGKSRIERQRIVYALLAEEMAGPIHALTLTTQTPSESAK